MWTWVYFLPLILSVFLLFLLLFLLLLLLIVLLPLLLFFFLKRNRVHSDQSRMRMEKSSWDLQRAEDARKEFGGCESKQGRLGIWMVDEWGTKHPLIPSKTT